MEPTLFAGDVVFIDARAYRSASPADLDVVVAAHPTTTGVQIIKRVKFTTEAGAYLSSDNPDAEGAADSGTFGVVPVESIIGRVTAVSRIRQSSTLDI